MPHPLPDDVVQNVTRRLPRALFRKLTSDTLEAQTRCLVAYSLHIGTHFVAAEHPGRTR